MYQSQSAPVFICYTVNPLSLIAQHVHLKMEHYPYFRFVLLFKASICFRLFLLCFVFLHLSTFCASGTFFSLIFVVVVFSCFIKLYIYVQHNTNKMQHSICNRILMTWNLFMSILQTESHSPKPRPTTMSRQRRG